MNKHLCALALAILFSTLLARSQSTPPEKSRTENSDVVNFGFGFGQDYGGLGGNITAYPQQNIGLFAGFGYAIAGFGYNAGIKLRLLPGGGRSKVRPFIEAMYGYNAAVAVTNYSNYNKMFYGPTVGAGLDIGSFVQGRGHFSVAILVPIRSPDVDNYINELNTNYGVNFNNNLLPVTFSIGYKFVL